MQVHTAVKLSYSIIEPHNRLYEMVDKICVRLCPLGTRCVQHSFKWDDTMALGLVSSPVYKRALILSMRYSERISPSLSLGGMQKITNKLWRIIKHESKILS